MMRRIVASSLKFRRLVVAVAAVGIVVGMMQLGQVEVDQLPEFGPTVVEVRTEALGLSATEVEQLITVPLEQDLLNGIAFVEDIHSESMPGLSSVTMIFEPGTPLLDARQVVQEKVAEAAVALPGVSAPPQMLQPYSSTSRVLAVRLSSDEMDPIQMSVLARWNIVPRLLGIQGVANVSIWGFRDKQLQVLVDPERLRDSDVTLQQIVETTGNSLWFSPLTFLEASTPGTAGFIDTPNQRIGFRHELPIRTPDDLALIPIEGAESGGDQTLTLGDVTEIVEDHQPLIGDALFRDGSGLLLVVERFPEASTMEVTHSVEEALEGLRPGLGGMEVDTSFYRPAGYVEDATDNLALTLLIGGILLVLALAVLMWDRRATLTSAVAVLLSLIVAGAVLIATDVAVNTMILAGIVMAIGVVIGDAVADVRHVAGRLRARRAGGSGEPIWRTVLDAAVEMRSSILYATIIIVVSIVPAFFLEEQAGAFLPAIVLSYVLAIGASMLVALVVTPSLAMLLPSTRRGVSPVIQWMRRRNERALKRMVRRPRWSYAAIGVALVAGVAMFPFLDRSTSVGLEENDLVIQWDSAPGTSLPAMNSVTEDAVAELGALPSVVNVSAHVGRAVHSDQIVNVNSGQIWVNLDPEADRDEAVTSIEQVLAGYPDIAHHVTTYSEERITDVLQGTDEDVVLRLYGADREILESKAEEVRSLLAGIEGIVRPTAELAPTEPTIEVEVDLERAQEFTVSPGEVRRAASIYLSGLTVGNLFEEQKVFDVVVWGTPQNRESVEDVGNLLIDTGDGGHVRLSQVADVRVEPNPTVIRHEAVSNYLDVSAGIAGRDADAVVSDVRAAMNGVEFPLEHHLEIRGAFSGDQASSSRILAVAVAAAIGVFLLLQAAFTSWRLAALVFVTLPIALVGGLIAAAIAGGTVGLGSFAGLLAVLGIAARNGVLLFRHFQFLEVAEGEAFGDELVIRGTREQIGSTLITAIGTIVALLPFVFADGAGLELIRPMAIVMLGGMVTSTLLALLVLPVLYRLHGFVAEKDAVAEDLLVIPDADVEVEQVRGS